MVVRAVLDIAVGDVLVIRREDIGNFGTHPTRPCLVIELQGALEAPVRALVAPGSRSVREYDWPFFTATAGEAGLEVETHFKLQHLASIGIRRLAHAPRVGRLTGLRASEIVPLAREAKDRFASGGERAR